MRFSRSFAALGLALVCQGALAQPPAEQPSTLEREKIFEQASRTAIPGPASIELLGKATLDLAEEYVFVGPPEAFRILHAFDPGARASEVLGLVFPKELSQQWFVAVDHRASQGQAYDAQHVSISNAKGQGFDALQSSSWVQETAADTGNPIIALLQGSHGVDRPFALSVTATADGSEAGRLNAQMLANAFAYGDSQKSQSLFQKQHWIALGAFLLALSWWVQGRLTRRPS